VPEAKSGKNRMHIDLVVEDILSEVSRLEGLGAQRLHEGVRTFGTSEWVTMADPEGNEFCVCTGVEW
jgi:predicted enzyme related to lactoylglutathione lyase